MALLVPANTLIRDRTAERYGLAALEATEPNAERQTLNAAEKAHAAPPATKARTGPQTTKGRP